MHRDLKPENILFIDSGMGKIKITDFGFGTHHNEGEKLLTACGSLAYSAPELLMEDEYDGRAVDIWSLGVILYMLVVGKFPFSEHNPSETITSILEGDYQIPENISSSCAALIRSMLKRDLDERSSLSAVMESEWLRPVLTASETKMGKKHLSESNLSQEQVESVYGRLEEIGIKPEVVKHSLKHDLYDHVSATYHLLVGQELNKLASTSTKSSKLLQSEDSKHRRNTTCLSPSSEALPFEVGEERLSEANLMSGNLQFKASRSSRSSLRGEDRADSDPNLHSPASSTVKLNSSRSASKNNILSPTETPTGSHVTLRKSASLDSLDKEIKMRPNDSFARDDSSSYDSVDLTELLKSKFKEDMENLEQRSGSASGVENVERSNLNFIAEDEEEEVNGGGDKPSVGTKSSKKYSRDSGKSHASKTSRTSMYSLKDSKISESAEKRPDGDVSKEIEESSQKRRKSRERKKSKTKKHMCSDICIIL